MGNQYMAFISAWQGIFKRKVMWDMQRISFFYREKKRKRFLRLN